MSILTACSGLRRSDPFAALLSQHDLSSSSSDKQATLGEVPSFRRVVTKCGIYTCIYQTNMCCLPVFQ